MGFDLFTLAAQIVNFVILLVLLRVFLYGPIRRVMQERERRIADAREQARQARDAARDEAERLEREREAWRRQRLERERALDEDLRARREARLTEIEEEMADAGAALADALERDERDLEQRIRRRSLNLLTTELRRALADLANASLERQAIAAFVGRLHRLSEDEATALTSGEPGAEAVVTTAFEPDEAQRDELRSVLQEVIGPDVPVRMERDPTIGFGVVLQRGGRRVAWSAEAYADAFVEAQRAVLGEATADLRGAASARREVGSHGG